MRHRFLLVGKSLNLGSQLVLAGMPMAGSILWTLPRLTGMIRNQKNHVRTSWKCSRVIVSLLYAYSLLGCVRRRVLQRVVTKKGFDGGPSTENSFKSSEATSKGRRSSSTENQGYSVSNPIKSSKASDESASADGRNGSRRPSVGSSDGSVQSAPATGVNRRKPLFTRKK